MRMEKKIEINSSVDRIFHTVTDRETTLKWNIVLKDITDVEEEKLLLKTDLGDIKIKEFESVENESATWHMEEADINTIGYILKPIENAIETTLWVDFDNEKLSKGYEKTGELLVKSLKRFVDFFEEGGNPDEFDKTQIMVTP